MAEANINGDHLIRVYVENGAGQRFEADVPCGTKIGKLAGDFFNARGWPTQDYMGRGQRTVVELVNPTNTDDTKRLNSDEDICESGVHEGDTLRVFPESRAGIVDQRARHMALAAGYNDIQALCRENPNITFTANKAHAPDLYMVTLHYISFVALPAGEDEPIKADTHQFEIELGAGYPGYAPIVTWKTPIFHPNIKHPEGRVCLGDLGERYRPSMGLARLVRMLVEMVQWQNFDAFNPFNPEAAEWAVQINHWPFILAIGGYPWQGRIEQFIKELDRAGQPPIIFKPLSPEP